ncbi:MAG: hypothetical protein HRT89_18505 [Lentisphaeria bacterium]|nr:hypothetical protein [Lentisphaeria bacterium]
MRNLIMAMFFGLMSVNTLAQPSTDSLFEAVRDQVSKNGGFSTENGSVKFKVSFKGTNKCVATFHQASQNTKQPDKSFRSETVVNLKGINAHFNHSDGFIYLVAVDGHPFSQSVYKKVDASEFTGGNLSGKGTPSQFKIAIKASNLGVGANLALNNIIRHCSGRSLDLPEIDVLYYAIREGLIKHAGTDGLIKFDLEFQAKNKCYAVLHSSEKKMVGSKYVFGRTETYFDWGAFSRKIYGATITRFWIWKSVKLESKYPFMNEIKYENLAGFSFSGGKRTPGINPILNTMITVEDDKQNKLMIDNMKKLAEFCK